MILQNKYNEIMQKLTVTPEMRERVLQNLARAGFEAVPEQKRAAFVVFCSKWKGSIALAACTVLLFAGVLAMPSLIGRQSGLPVEQASSSKAQSHNSEQRNWQEESQAATSEGVASEPLYTHEQTGSSAAPAQSGSTSQAPKQEPASQSDASAGSAASASAVPPVSSTAQSSASQQIVSSSIAASSSEQASSEQRTFILYGTPDTYDEGDQAPDPVLGAPPNSDSASITSCETRSELEYIVGYTVEGARVLPFITRKVEYTAYSGSIAQIEYIGVRGQTACWRKAIGQTNNSAALIEASKTEAFTQNGMEVTLMGSDDGYSYAWWTDGEYSYSLALSEELSASEWKVLLTRI